MEEEIKKLTERLTELENTNKELTTKLEQQTINLSTLETQNKELQDNQKRYIDTFFKFGNNESTIKDTDLSIDEKIEQLQKKKGTSI